MKIFLLFSLALIAFLYICRKVLSATKRNLFKDQEAWSGKDIKIKYRTSKETSESKDNDNFLKMIAEESKLYLEDQSKKKENGKNQV